ncbi:MAG TPA: hypothetical protein PKJ56_05640 [Promineifilum sp.]|nr:hypothetical protein [Promineifilum sp.]
MLPSTAPVVIDLSAGGGVLATSESCDGDAEGEATCVYFTPDNWNVPQVVTVRANGSGEIQHIVTSADAVYSALTIDSVEVSSSFRLFIPMSSRG